MQTEPLTTPATRKMLAFYLGSDDEQTVRKLSRIFRPLRFTRAMWRQAIRETREMSAV